MSADLLLTESELFNLTGYERFADQRKWLSARGWRYEITANGRPSDTSALDAYVAEKVKESHKVIPREGLVPHAYQLEATHNNAEYWYKFSSLLPRPFNC